MDDWARADLTATNGRNVLFALLLRSLRCFQIIRPYYDFYFLGCYSVRLSGHYLIMMSKYVAVM